MSIKRVDAYMAVCDHESCTHVTRDHNDEYAFWSELDGALQDALDGGWIEEGDKLFCPCHDAEFIGCESCGERKRSTMERDDGLFLCDDCDKREEIAT